MSNLAINPIGLPPLDPALRAGMLSTAHVTHSNRTTMTESSTHGNSEVTDMHTFNQAANIDPRSRLLLFNRPLQFRLHNSQRNSMAANPKKSAGTPQDAALLAAAEGAIEILQESGKAALESQLNANYDALERHTLLDYATRLLDEQDLNPSEKERLKTMLDELREELMDTHGNVIRPALKQAEAFSSALGTMDALASADAGHDLNSLHQLRTLYSDKSNKKTSAPLTPLALAKTLQEKFGANNFMNALNDLRKKMSSDFRNNPVTHPGPRLWLSLSDAAAFNIVQTAFAFGCDLRRDLWQRARITPYASQAGTALALLGASELGAHQVDQLVKQTIGNMNLNVLQKTQAYRLLRYTIERLPTTMWQERLPQRLSLLDELRALAHNAFDAMELTSTREKQLEQELRERQGRNKQGGGEEKQQQDDSNTNDEKQR